MTDLELRLHRLHQRILGALVSDWYAPEPRYGTHVIIDGWTATHSLIARGYSNRARAAKWY